MYFLDAYLPLFSHVEHLLRAVPDGKAPSGIDGATLREATAGCTRLALRLRSETAIQRGSSAEAAWFPVRAWLSEKLAQLPFGGEAESALPPPEENAGVLFALRLDNLRLKTASGAATADEKDLLRLYAACLELGYGGQQDPPAEEERLRCARQCRALLGRTPEAGDAGAKNIFARLPARAAAFAAAPLAVGILYCLYRALLSNLLRDVIR